MAHSFKAALLLPPQATARRRPLVYVRSFRGADEGHEEMAAAQLPAASPAPLAPPPPGRNSDLVLVSLRWKTAQLAEKAC